MTDACGCGSDEPREDSNELEEQEPERLWEVSELRFAAAAGLFLVAGFVRASSFFCTAVSFLLSSSVGSVSCCKSHCRSASSSTQCR